MTNDGLFHYRSSIVSTSGGEMSDLTGSNARTYEFQFPQKLFDICKKLPAETDQWLNATNNKGQCERSGLVMKLYCKI